MINFRTPWARAGVAAVAAGAVIGALVVAGAGNPAQDVRLLSGAAWLASPKVGQATLLDGATAEVAGQVQVAAAGNDIEVVQQAMTAYVVDRSAGTIKRVDGATFHPTDPARPIPQVTGGLTAFAGPNSLYALDTQHGIVTEADPRTGAGIGQAQPMSAQLAANTAVVDDAGRLWVVDTATGDLTRIAGGRRTKETVTGAGHSVLTLVDGSPVIVNTTLRTAVTVDTENGTARTTIDLDLRADENVQVGGSPHSKKLYVVAARGLVTICDLAAGNCDRAIPLTGTQDLGGPVEAANRLFVPDYGGGKVWIIDLTTYASTGQADVGSPGSRFQLLNRDGVVFFNDLQSERAGVIELDGKVRRTNKYDPKNPQKGTSATASATNGTSSSKRTTSSTSATTSTSQAKPNDPPPLPVAIRVTKVTPLVNEDITLSADSDGVAPANVEWGFADGTSGSGIPVSHRWSTPGSYMVTAQVTMPDGRRGTGSLNVTVSRTPKFRLTVTTNAGGSVTTTDGEITCGATSTCYHDYDQGTHVTVSAQPSTDYALSQWGKACSGAGACEVTMDAAKEVQASFKPTKANLTVQIAAAGGSVKLNNQACNACTLEFPVGQNVPLAAFPDADHDFDSWDTQSCADVHNVNCTTQANTTRTIVARFKPKPKYALTIKWDGQGSWYGKVTMNGSKSGNKTCQADSNTVDPPPCVTQYQAGEQVTLTGQQTQATFTGWRDACQGQGSQDQTCRLTMTGPLTATAEYTIIH